SPTDGRGGCGAPLTLSACVALEPFFFCPSPHTRGIASSAVLPSPHVAATPATAESPTCTTCLTPGMPLTLSASKLFTLPPNTGQSLMAAFSMPGSFRSAPYTWAPVTLPMVSSRLTDLPMIFQSLGSFSAMLLASGGVSLAAASATLPYVVVRPVGLCVIVLLAALHSATGTPHALAAAWTSIVRATAPPWRTY